METITSTQHLLARAIWVLERAKKNLAADGNLAGAAIFNGRRTLLEIHPPHLSTNFVRALIRGVIDSRPDVELVIYVGLATAVDVADFKRLPLAPEKHPDRKKVIRAEAAHADFGIVNLHVEYQQASPETYVFGEIIQIPEAMHAESVVNNLWPKRKLNS